MQVSGKVAIVTGGGTGIGKATVLGLAAAGARVVVNYSRSKAEAEETAAQARAAGVEAITHQANVADDEACRGLIDAAVRQFGRLDVLVNNAGTTRFIPHVDLESVTTEDWDRILGTNLRGAFQCARAAKQPMIASGGGAIINVTSVAGIAGIGSSIPYAASKAAMNNLTLTLAKALAPKIRVNAVAPGFVAGKWLEQGLGAGYEALRRGVERRTPLGRVSEPDDIAAAILSLITGSDQITGQILVCDGGMLINV